MTRTEAELRDLARQHGQDHVFQFWDTLDASARQRLLADLDQVDFHLTDRLAQEWILSEPGQEVFQRIDPLPVIPKVDPARPDCAEALAAGEEALRSGRVGMFLVAGGQGTRLGFDGPKGSYPIGPVSKRSLFAFHAEKIHHARLRYGVEPPWYIMVSEENAADTRAFFESNACFGLDPRGVHFFTQRMVPCLDDSGKLMLAAPDRLAMNPNGHGGCLPALVENGILDDARDRGIDTLSYFQVDNWAANIGDPYFIGYHVLRGAEMSSKIHRKRHPRESVGVHCVCDGLYRVIEYSELDIYPQLLETDAAGNVVHFAGNPAIHILAVDFVQRIYREFEAFPWHRAHKKVPYYGASGSLIKPDAPNAYKFETFVFDALRYTTHPPVALEIEGPGEYTPIKSFSGDNSVEGAWAVMREYWAQWLEAAGCKVPRAGNGAPSIEIEVSPQFAMTREEFLRAANGRPWPAAGPIAIGPDGSLISASA